MATYDDVDYLYQWAQQAQERIRALEEALRPVWLAARNRWQCPVCPGTWREGSAELHMDATPGIECIARALQPGEQGKVDIIKAGSVVRHRPTGEKWRVLGVDGRGSLCVAGWPASIAKVSDCDFIEQGPGLSEHEVAHVIREFGASFLDAPADAAPPAPPALPGDLWEAVKELLAARDAAPFLPPGGPSGPEHMRLAKAWDRLRELAPPAPTGGLPYLTDYEIVAAKGVKYYPGTVLWYGVTEHDRRIANAATEQAVRVMGGVEGRGEAARKVLTAVRAIAETEVRSGQDFYTLPVQQLENLLSAWNEYTDGNQRSEDGN